MSNPDLAEGPIWPSADYYRQVARLRAAIGRPIYILELEASETTLGARHLGKPLVLLDVLDFPRPDPARGIAPHLLLLDDGRGVNLGRIARASIGRPFNPSPAELLYQDPEAHRRLLFQGRQLSKRMIAERADAVTGRLLGRGQAGRRQIAAQSEHPDADGDDPRPSDGT